MELKLKINGMSCDHCTSYVRKILGEISSLEVIDVNLEGALVKLSDSSAKEQVESVIKSVIEDAGYELVTL